MLSTSSQHGWLATGVLLIAACSNADDPGRSLSTTEGSESLASSSMPSAGSIDGMSSGVGGASAPFDGAVPAPPTTSGAAGAGPQAPTGTAGSSAVLPPSSAVEPIPMNAAGASNSGGRGGNDVSSGPGAAGAGSSLGMGGSVGVGGTSGGGGALNVAGSAGSSAGVSGSTGSAPFPENVDPPVSDSSSNLPVAGPGGGYRVDGNLPYGDLPEQRLDVMYPNGGGPDATTKSPGVIMFHGGGWIQGDKATMSSFYNRFLAHGFVVCSAEYRVADGDPDHIAPAAVEDALLAAKWFWDYLDYYNVDRGRYVVTGASAGGHLALMVGMATPEAGFGPTSPEDFEIAAIVNGYGPADVSDLLQRNTSFAVQWLPANTPDRDALAVRLSPITYARADMPPLISVHGSNDTTVPVAQSEHLDELLQAAGADAELHLVAGAGHGFSSPSGAWPDAEQAMFGFLEDRGISE